MGLESSDGFHTGGGGEVERLNERNVEVVVGGVSNNNEFFKRAAARGSAGGDSTVSGKSVWRRMDEI